ncbi:MAG: ATP-dependent zinc metalloprotease FtsH [Firmicutes bacterium]|nr:ATP-dependent zinc metalloprotease FtsH [Bacillota bacterium]
MVIITLLNALVFPLLLERPVIEVSYSDFLDMLEQGSITNVNMQEAQIVFEAAEKDGALQIYKTGIWPDENLLDRLREAKVTFSNAIPTQNSPLLNFLISWIFPILFFLFIGRLLMNSLSKRMGGNMMSFGKSGAKVYVPAQTGKTFADVAGQDEAKEALAEIVDFLHNPAKYAAIGAIMPKGALLVGPPGTGKTLLAKAVAGEANVPFFSISGSEFVEMFVGMGAAKVRDLFKQAYDKAPCIVFIDEIDTIGKKRDGISSISGNDEREQTLNQLLSEMDGFDGRKGVVILGATNRPETLDKALLRPGRFDRRIPVELPDLKGREDTLKVHAKSIQAAKDVDYLAIAKATPGASGAELANILNEAALRAVRMGRDIVNQNDLEESVEVILAGYQRKNAVLTPNEKKIVAYHEIGHALVAARQSSAAPVHKITIIPRTSGALGYILQMDDSESDRVLLTKEEVISKITTATGGRAAEMLVFGTATTGAANDIEQATKLARAMISRYGMSDQFGMVALEAVTNQYLGGDASLICSPETASKIDGEVVELVGRCLKSAEELLKQNTQKLRELAEFLYEKETLTGEEFMRMLAR